MDPLNGSVELAIAAMALGQKAPSFDSHDSGHGRKIQCVPLQFTPHTHPIHRFSPN